MRNLRHRELWENISSTIHPVRSTSFRLTTTPHLHRWLVGLIAIVLVITAVFLGFVPWQQTVIGSGQVTSFAPDARPQTIESAISGRVVKWYVNEGVRVRKGDTLVILSDIGTSFFDRQLLDRLSILRDQTVAAQDQAIEAAMQRRRQAEQRYNQSVARFDNAVVQASTARIRFQRADTLFRQDELFSRRQLETAQLDLQKAIADSVSAAAAVLAAMQDVETLRADELRTVNSASVAVQEVDVRLANATGRIGAGTVLAPIDGTVVRINRFGSGQTVKEGEQLAVIVPTTDDQAAEIYVSGMDAAIVEPGRRVSLQFAGFPAFMFSGWANISVGIFHGRIKVIDAVDDGTGRFRLLVVPEDGGRRWPDQRFLRQGTSVTGWVMLEEVVLGYEIWRRVMGFPPEFPVAPVSTSNPSASGKANTGKRGSSGSKEGL
jgi:multidrug resistance efflux pump